MQFVKKIVASNDPTFNKRWHISTTRHTIKCFCMLFKLIQQFNMVTLSCLLKKNRNLNSRKNFQILIFLHEATQGDQCTKMCDCVGGYIPASVNMKFLYQITRGHLFLRLCTTESGREYFPNKGT